MKNIFSQISAFICDKNSQRNKCRMGIHQHNRGHIWPTYSKYHINSERLKVFIIIFGTKKRCQNLWKLWHWGKKSKTTQITVKIFCAHGLEKSI